MEFSISDSRVSSLFEIVHVDVWSPYQKQTYDGKIYFLALVDDFSRVTQIYLIVNKYYVAITLKEFIALIYKQFNVGIKKIKSDNGVEFSMMIWMPCLT